MKPWAWSSAAKVGLSVLVISATGCGVREPDPADRGEPVSEVAQADAPLDGLGVGQPCVTDTACHSQAACFDGMCLCKPGFIACGERCVDHRSNGLHCGACGHAC